MAEKSAAKPARGGLRWKAVTLLAVGLGVFVAAEAGLLGFGWHYLLAATFPRDEALLRFLPRDTRLLAVIDPHQLELSSLGAEGSTARTAVERTRADVQKATGIDLAFDVDKLVLTPSLAVARGRFDAGKLEQRLAEYRYVAGDHKGTRYLAREGEDAIAVVGGDILLYGDLVEIKAGLDARDAGTSLDKDELVLERLRHVGWDHPLVVTLRMSDDRPSLRAMLTGGTGPRGLTVGVATKSGLDVHVSVDAASPGSAEELRKLMEEKRGSVDALLPYAGGEVAPLLLAAAKKAVIAVDPGGSTVSLRLRLDPAAFDALVKAAGKAVPLGEMYKSMRLYQLLVP